MQPVANPSPPAPPASPPQRSPGQAPSRAVGRGAATFAWTLAFLLLVELVARALTRPETLLELEIASYASMFAHRQQRAATEAGPIELLVLGDSTAERGVDACTLSPGRGLNLSLPSGATREATQLVDTLGPRLAPEAHLLYVVNPLNVRVASEWIHPTFADLRRRGDLASALLGSASHLYQHRDAVLAVLESRIFRRRYRADFAWQIGRTGRCGREVDPPKPEELPDAKAREAQLRRYASDWVAVFEAPVGGDTVATLGAGLAGLTGPGRRLTVVLAPLRPDFVSFLDQRYPGLQARRRAVFVDAARRAGATVLDCAGAVTDPAHFHDPVHLGELGRRALSACLAPTLAGGQGCCAPLVGGEG